MKDLFLFGFFQKEGKGVMSESKLFEELVGSVYVWTFFRKRGGGLPYFKLFEKLFCLDLEIFQEGGGGVPDSKTIIGFDLDIFQLKFGSMTKVQTL